MVCYIAKHYIDTNQNQPVEKRRGSYGVLCGIAGIFFNLLLFAGKLFAGTISRSIAITADAFNNLSDASSSVVTLIGFRLAGQKADTEHPFGHGRIEYVSGLIVAMAILLMGFELAKSSISKILHPSIIAFQPITVIILIVSILIKCYMAYYNRFLGKRIQSPAILATATDSLSDTIATSAVLLSTLIAHFTGLMIDGWCGVIVSILILFAGFNAAKDTINPLLGQPPEEDFVLKVHQIVLQEPMISGIHDMVVHNYGPGRIMVSLHAEVPCDEDILVIHDMIDNVEKEISTQLNCEAVIHMDPIAINDPETRQLHEEIAHMAITIHPEITIHDFRMVKGTSHTNLIFDLVAPPSYKETDEVLQNQLQSLVRSHLGDSFCLVVHIDHNYIK